MQEDLQKQEEKQQKDVVLKKKFKQPKVTFDLNPFKVNFFNVWKKFPKKVAFIFLSALLYNIGVATFLAKAATVASGVSALVQGLTYTVSQTAPYFAYIYLALNLPFMVAFWKKNPRIFMILTMYWLLFQVLIQSFLLIRPIGDMFHKISIYYVNWKKTTTWNNLIPWDVYGAYDNSPGFTPTPSGFSNPTWPIIIYSLIGAVCAGAAAGIAWKNSGSTAGSDIIVYYVSRVKKQSIGFISTIVALIFAAVSIVLIGLLEFFGVNEKKSWNPGAFLVRIISTVLYIFVYNGFLEVIYPKYRKIKITIYTKKAELIIAHLKAINYWHGYNYSTVTSGYNNQGTVKIETLALYLEQNHIKNEILKIDHDAWITISTISRIIGKFDTSKVD